MAATTTLLFIWGVSAITVVDGLAGPTFNDSVVHLVSSVLIEPFLMEREEGWFGPDPEYEGFIPDLLREASEHTGWHFKIRLATDGRVGDKLPTGHWDGMVGDLVRREVSLAAGPLTITSRRIRVIDFSKPFMSTGLVVAASVRPKVDGPNSATNTTFTFLLRPFTLTAWLLLTLAFILLVVCALVIRRLSPHTELGGMRSGSSCIDVRHWSACAFRFTAVSFSVLTVVLYTSGLASLLIYNADSRFEESKLSAEYLEDDTDLGDMVQSGLYKIGVVRDGTANAFLRHSSIPLYQSVYKRLDYVDNITTGLDMVRTDPNYIFLLDEPLLDYYLQKRPCQTLRKIGPPLTSNGFGLGFPIKSPLYDVINLIMLQLREEGVLQRLKRKWWHERAQCRVKAPPTVRERKPLPSPPSVDGSIVGGAMVLLGIGLLVALLASIVERLKESRTKKGSAVSGCLNESAGNLLQSPGGTEGRDLALT